MPHAGTCPRTCPRLWCMSPFQIRLVTAVTALAIAVFALFTIGLVSTGSAEHYVCPARRQSRLDILTLRCHSLLMTMNYNSWSLGAAPNKSLDSSSLLFRFTSRVTSTPDHHFLRSGVFPFRIGLDLAKCRLLDSRIF